MFTPCSTRDNHIDNFTKLLVPSMQTLLHLHPDVIITSYFSRNLNYLKRSSEPMFTLLRRLAWLPFADRLSISWSIFSLLGLMWVKKATFLWSRNKAYRCKYLLYQSQVSRARVAHYLLSVPSLPVKWLSGSQGLYLKNDFLYHCWSFYCWAFAALWNI